LVLLQNFVIALKPTIALFLVGANDVGLSASNGYDAALTPPHGIARRAAFFVVDHSEVASTTLNLVRAARAHRSGFGHSQIDLPTAPRLALDASVIDATIADHERYLEGFRERLRTIAELCQANRIEPIFVTQPALFGEGVDPQSGVDLSTVQVNGRGNGRLEWRLLERYNDVTRRVAADAGVLLIDLARELPKDSRLFYDFLHYTNEGAARVGEIIAAHLEPRLRARTRLGH
jgi:lysophospholipase L1-like esterase